MIKVIFDIGMYDGADTAYYLESGFRVVAVEANPALIERAREQFAQAIAASRLTLCNAAIGPTAGSVSLILCGDDLGSSSLLNERLENRHPVGSIEVPTISLNDLFAEHGVPYYLKVDIEGADRFCILELGPGILPQYVSFELGSDAEELIQHLRDIGYRSFKIINQVCHRELANTKSLYDRAAHGLMRRMGFREPMFLRRAGRFFRAGRSSGPLPSLTDGKWYGGDKTLARWQKARVSTTDWFDLHATLA